MVEGVVVAVIVLLIGIIAMTTILSYLLVTLQCGQRQELQDREDR